MGHRQGVFQNQNTFIAMMGKVSFKSHGYNWLNPYMSHLVFIIIRTMVLLMC